jgi:WhiB family redox-sensing transcriptional regulator
MPWVEEWPSQGACRGEDPDALFVQGAAQQQAKLVCRSCPVRSECLAHALDTRTEFGVWGGLTERERRQWLRDHPEVVSWRTLLERAKDDHEGGRVPGAPVSSAPRQRGPVPHETRSRSTQKAG